MKANDIVIGGKSAREVLFNGALVWQKGEYEVLEYIESTGTQWIDTEVVCDSYDFSVDCKFAPRVNSSSHNVDIVYSSVNKNNTGGGALRCYFGGLGDFYLQCFSACSQNGTACGQIIKDSIYDIKEHGKDGFYINGVYWKSGQSLAAISKGTLLLFNQSNASREANACIYSFALRNGSILVRDFLPARRLVDGEVGMYDTVTKQFFTNQGSGKFIAGPSTGRYI